MTRHEFFNVGGELAAVMQLLDRAERTGFVGAGEVAIAEIRNTLNNLLAVDSVRPLRFTVETADITDTEVGEKTGTQSRLVGQWWVDVPDTMPPGSDPLSLPQQKPGNQILHP